MNKIIAIVLAFALFVGIPQFTVLATLIDRSDSYVQTEAVVDEPENAAADKKAVIIGEDESLRKEAVKKFRLSDGSYIAAMYDEAVNYNDNGVWKEIDNTLLLKEGYYTNSANSFKVSLPEKLSGDAGITIGYGQYKIAFSPFRASGACASVVQPEKSRLDGLKERSTELALQNKESSGASSIQGLDSDILKMNADELVTEINNEYMSVKKAQSSVNYAGIYSGVNVEYKLQSDKLKESIILDSADTVKHSALRLIQTGLPRSLPTTGP